MSAILNGAILKECNTSTARKGHQDHSAIHRHRTGIYLPVREHGLVQRSAVMKQRDEITSSYYIVAMLSFQEYNF